MTARRSGRAVLYARVSTHDQNLDLQRDEGRALVARRGWTLVEVYEDHGISGTRASRPSLDRMLGDARRRRFDTLVVWRADRLFRSLPHMIAALEELRELGIDFVSCTEPFDTSTSTGRLLFHMVSAFAQFERDTMIERTVAGMHAARRRGVRMGRPARRIGGLELARHLLAFGMSERDVATQLELPRSTLRDALNKEPKAA